MMKKRKKDQFLAVKVETLTKSWLLFVFSFITVIVYSLLCFASLVITQIKNVFLKRTKTVYIDMVVSEGLDVVRPKKIIGNDIVFIFDIDDTLVHTGHGLSEAEKNYLNDIFHKELENKGITPEIPFLESICNTNLYTKTFLEHNFTSEQFWKWSDSFPFKNHVKRDEETINLIKSLKSYVRICALTNAEILRSKIVLESLGVDGLIETVITTTRRDSVIIHKPMLEAYRFVDKVLTILDKKKVYFFDDSLNNVITAKSHGWNAYYTPKHSDLKDAVNQALFNAGIANGKYSGFGSLYNKKKY